MKKNMILAAAVAASTILLSLSCTKQDSIQSMDKARVFTASIEQIQTKTTLDGLKVNWSEGDKISIMNGETGERSVYSATPKANGTADFTVADGEKELIADHYFAVYPDYLLPGGEVGFRLPNIQVYETGKLNTPMFAMSDTEELTFKNMCGVVCFALTGSVEIGRIELWADDIKLWGETEVNFETGAVKTIGEITDENNRVTLRCEDNMKKGVKLTGATTYFYIYLPVIENIPAGSLHAKIWGTDGGYKELTSGTDVTVEANNIYTFEYTIDSFDSQQGEPATPAEPAAPTLPELDYMLSGAFSVSSDEQVYFSRGNLQATNNGTSWEFNFAEQQFLFIGANNISGDNLSSTIDLFGWSSTAQDNNYGIFITETESTFNDEFNDWGKNVTLSDRNWFTLSETQWKYLLNINGTSGRSDANRFAAANVEGVQGLLIFPDGYNEDVEISNIDGICSLNSCNYSFPYTQLDREKWIEMQDDGVVFLPRAGKRQGIQISLYDGLYWTTSDMSLIINNGEFFLNYMPKGGGQSVRLVTSTKQDTQEAQEER